MTTERVAILGATASIGRALARQWAARGAALALSARDADELRLLADDLHARYGARPLEVPLDVTDLSAHAGAVQTIRQQLGPLTCAVLMFGDMGDPGADPADPEHIARVVDVNFTALASLSEQLVGALQGGGRGVLVGVTSVAGDRGRASNYLYGASKAAATAYLSGLRGRLQPQGIHVLTMKYGWIDTPMTFGLSTRLPVPSPESAAAALLAAVAARRDVVYHPWFWRAIMSGIKAIPEPIFKRMRL